MPANDELLHFKISKSSSTFFFDIRLMLVCHEVDPVPVDTHSPELFVFVIFCDELGRIWRWLTRAERVSPMKTWKKQHQRIIFIDRKSSSLSLMFFLWILWIFVLLLIIKIFTHELWGKIFAIRLFASRKNINNLWILWFIYTSLRAKYGSIRLVNFLFCPLPFPLIWSMSVGSLTITSLCSTGAVLYSCKSTGTGALPLTFRIVMRILDRCIQSNSPVWILLTPSSTSVVNCFGSIKRPSDLFGSELKPTIGTELSMNNGLARDAARRNVPSPPTGTIMSVHLKQSRLIVRRLTSLISTPESRKHFTTFSSTFLCKLW